MLVVSDASLLVILSQIGLFSLLKDLFHEVHITDAVFHEVVTKGEGRAGVSEVLEALTSWMRRHPDPSPKGLRQFHPARQVSVADATVLALAQTLKATHILSDDKVVRRGAKAANITAIGVGGILLLAKRQGLISAVRAPLEQVVAEGLRADKGLLHEIVTSAGEL